MFKEVYSKVKFGNPAWNSLEASDSLLYPWDEKSTYIKSPPFFENMVIITDLSIKRLLIARLLHNGQ